jgi:ribosomal protein S18 acetylase RimI-like enzyme
MEGEVACAKALAFLSGKVAGLAHMSGVWVDPRYRRRGLGRRMVEEARAWAASKGAERMLLWVDDTNPEGARFYVSLGFLRTGESRPVSPTSLERESAFVVELGASY